MNTKPKLPMTLEFASKLPNRALYLTVGYHDTDYGKSKVMIRVLSAEVTIGPEYLDWLIASLESIRSVTQTNIPEVSNDR